MRPHQSFHELGTLRDSLQVPVMRKGVVLSNDDTSTVMDVYLQWILLLTDMGYLTPDASLRQERRLLADLARRDVLEVNGACAECLQLVRLKSNKGFKALCSFISPHIYPLLKRDMELVITANAFAARRLTQVFSYTSRLSLRDIDLTQQLLEDYCRVEENIRDDYPTGLVQQLNAIMRRWIGSFVPGEIVPKHGPGSVAGDSDRTIQSKYENLATDSLLEYCFGSPWWITKDGQTTLVRESETIFVPKSYKTFRTISMEPPTLQYFQQGIWRLIDSQVESNRYLRARIGFHEQIRNQELAKRGSLMRDFATLDLSSASDTVSYKLVKMVFRGTWLYRYLIATRSRTTKLPNGQQVLLKKFAPMGSALCFPIETLIFAAICEHVTRVCGFSGQFSVFGDDIIVPTQCVEMVKRCLANLGFIVNHSKSFSDPECWFRESCGGEYFNGFDATPVRVSRKFSSSGGDIRLQELVDLANAAYSRGYRLLRQYFVQRILRYTFGKEKRNLIPLFSPTNLLSDNYSNYRAKRRWNRKLHRIEILIDDERAQYDLEVRKSQCEIIRYRYWLESTQGRESLGWVKSTHGTYVLREGFESVICRPTTVIKPVWAAKPYELSDQEFIDQQTRSRVKPTLN